MGTSYDTGSASVSRRNFLKLSGVLAACLGLAGCDNTLEPAKEGVAYTSDEKWVPVTCWVDCGGKCPCRAQVKDGMVMRIKTDDTKEDTVEYPQQRACARGRSQRHHVLSADRLKYPMKRKNWNPGGGKQNVHPELRGKDEWERISWDEALQLCADELTRVNKDFGSQSIVITDSMRTEPHSLRNKLGGGPVMYMTASYGSYQNGGFDVGTAYNTAESCLDRFELMKSELIVMWGFNPAWSSGGNPAYILKNCKDAGAKFVGIDPFYNDTYSAMDAEWIPIRPGTDMAMMLAMIYTLLDEDDPQTNPIIDWEFVNKCTIGFDDEHMPVDAVKSENLKGYVLGTYDSIPKTPEWAEEICGVPADKIRELTRMLRPEKNISILTSYAPSRTYDTDNLPQLFMALGALTGRMGKSGNMCGIANFWNACNGGTPLVENGTTYTDLFTSYSSVFNDPREGSPIPYKDITVIEAKDLWNNVIPNKKAIDCGEALFNEINPRRVVDLDPRIIWSAFDNYVNCSPNTMNAIDALRNYDVECIIRQDINFTASAQFADIVLPAITPWERPGGSAEYTYHPRETLIYYFQVIEPLYEAKDDQWIVSEIGKKMGFDDLFPVSRESQEFIHMATAHTIDAQGNEAPIVTITQEDIDSYGLDDLREYLSTAKTTENAGGAGGTIGIDAVVKPFEIKPQEGEMGIAELKEKGFFQARRKPDDDYAYIPFKAMRDDPEKNPVHTASGKVELYCQTMADKLTGMGYSEVSPYPVYTPGYQGYEATYSDWGDKVKGEFPFQAVNPHYMGRQHSCMNNVDWLREAFDNPVYICDADAQAYGIVDGDTVLMTSSNGKALRRACVTNRFMPGVLGLPHGAWTAMDEKTGIDRGGNENTLTPSVPRTQAVDAYNSTMCNIEKYSGEPLASTHVEEPVAMAPVE